MAGLSLKKSLEILKKIPVTCQKINAWATDINKLESKSDFTKSHCSRLFKDSDGLLNESVMEALGFSDIKITDKEDKESVYFERCKNYLEEMKKRKPGSTAAKELGKISKEIIGINSKEEQQEYFEKLFKDFKALENAYNNINISITNDDTKSFEKLAWLTYYEKAWMPFLVSLTACVGAMNSLSQRL